MPTRSKSALFPAVSPRPDVGSTALRLDWAALGLVVAYAALQTLLALGHDPWLDEAQAWLLASSAPNPLDLLILPGEGHPPIWYWLLWGFSRVLDFAQARYFTLVVAIVNAVLLARLLRDHLPILAMVLFSFSILQFWGYHFRPYGLVFSCVIAALLLERADRPIAATWALAIACGLHFFSGFLFAFWLFWQWSKGTPVLRLVPPAALALLFGALALLSGGNGNTTIGQAEGTSLASLILDNLAWLGLIDPMRGPLTAVLSLAILVYGLRQRPLVAVVLVALLIAFSTGTALVYGRSPWHSTFMTMLCLMAYLLVGLTRQRAWILAIILIPQVSVGLVVVGQRLAHTVWTEDNLYEAVVADAGAGFDPARDLYGWPNIVIPPYTALLGIEMIDGNYGEPMGRMDWRLYNPERIDKTMQDRTTPYWLICGACDLLVGPLEKSGRVLTPLGKKVMIDHGEFTAYRVN